MKKHLVMTTGGECMEESEEREPILFVTIFLHIIHTMYLPTKFFTREIFLKIKVHVQG